MLNVKGKTRGTIIALCFAQLAIGVGANSIGFILPIFMTDLEISYSLIGIVLSSFPIVLAIFQYPFGRLSDKIGRRPLVVLGMAGYSVITYFYSLAHRFYEFLIVRCFQGFAGSINTSATSPLIADLVPSERRGTAMGAYNMVTGLAPVLAPVIGALIYEAFSPTYVFYFCSLLALLAFTITLLFVQEAPWKTQRPRSRELPSLSSLPYSTKRAVVFMFVAYVCLAISIFTIFPLIRVFMYATGASIKELGIAFSASQVASFSLTLPFGALSDRLKRRKPFIIFGLLGIATASVLIPSIKSIHELTMLLVLNSTAGAALGATSSALIADITPPEFRGRTFSIIFIGFSAGFAIGPILGGTLAEHFSFATPFYVTAIFTSVSAALMFFGVSEKKIETKTKADI